jgi:hypothetical protein
MNRQCDCLDWKDSQPKISGVFTSAHIHGVKYTGSYFVYCPFCSKRLVDVENSTQESQNTEDISRQRQETPESK